ncbi:MAG: group II intron reverse transcriptase/maturase, partial [Actinobacteria bacterium]|nr:group II intron reverse transcriptase/maturase [Actinomycetota bacterium]
VQANTDQRWVLLYVKRWLTALLQRPDKTLEARDRGTPQGSAISPLLSNLFMHYAFDSWLSREQPQIGFERYCDDVIVHCTSERQAKYMRDVIAGRLWRFGLKLHPEKTRIVYCKQDGRGDRHPITEFTFLGYTFRPRQAPSKNGGWWMGFLPAVSKAAKKHMAQTIRAWRLGRRTDLNFREIATMINRVVAGWINYYGRFYKSMLYPILRHLNEILVRWAAWKYKRLYRRRARARSFLAEVARRQPDLFAHWRLGVRP